MLRARARGSGGVREFVGPPLAVCAECPGNRQACACQRGKLCIAAGLCVWVHVTHDGAPSQQSGVHSLGRLPTPRSPLPSSPPRPPPSPSAFVHAPLFPVPDPGARPPARRTYRAPQNNFVGNERAHIHAARQVYEIKEHRRTANVLPIKLNTGCMNNTRKHHRSTSSAS